MQGSGEGLCCDHWPKWGWGHSCFKDGKAEAQRDSATRSRLSSPGTCVAVLVGARVGLRVLANALTEKKNVKVVKVLHNSQPVPLLLNSLRLYGTFVTAKKSLGSSPFYPLF